MKNLEGLNLAERNRLEDLIQRDPEGMGDIERKHIASRKAYLTADEQKTFAVCFEKPKVEPKAKK